MLIRTKEFVSFILLFWGCVVLSFAQEAKDTTALSLSEQSRKSGSESLNRGRIKRSSQDNNSKTKVQEEPKASEVENSFADSAKIIKAQLAKVQHEYDMLKTQFEELNKQNKALSLENERLNQSITKEKALAKNTVDTCNLAKIKNKQEADRIAVVRANYALRFSYDADAVRIAIESCESVTTEKFKVYRNSLLPLLKRYQEDYTNLLAILESIQNHPKRTSSDLMKTFVPTAETLLKSAKYYQIYVKQNKSFSNKFLDMVLDAAFKKLQKHKDNKHVCEKCVADFQDLIDEMKSQGAMCVQTK